MWCMWDVCVMKCSCVNMAVKGYKNHFKKHVERYLLLFLFNTCRCNINLHFFAKLTSLTLVLHCIHVKELVECSAFSSSRKIPRLSGGQEAVVNKSESGWVSIFISERREREREWDGKQHIAQSLVPAGLFLEMYSLAVKQLSSLSEDARMWETDGIVTNSNREQTLILDTSFERKWASCHLLNCEMMSI